MSWRGSDGEREILGRKRGGSWEQIERGRGKSGQRDGAKTMIWKWETWIISQIQCQLMRPQHVNCVPLCVRACTCERDKITLECKADTDHLLPDRGASDVWAWEMTEGDIITLFSENMSKCCQPRHRAQSHLYLCGDEYHVLPNINHQQLHLRDIPVEYIIPLAGLSRRQMGGFAGLCSFVAPSTLFTKTHMWIDTGHLENKINIIKMFV